MMESNPRGRDGALKAEPTESSSPDAIALLTADHRSVDAMFTNLESLTPQADGPAMVEILRRAIDSLATHATIEEEVFYPAIRGLLAEGESLADHSLEEHQQVRELMRELTLAQPSEPGFESGVARLINEVRHHVKEEEHEILPKLRMVIGEPQLVELGRKLEDARAELATQRPAPSIASAGPAEPRQTSDQLVDDLFEASHAPAKPMRASARSGRKSRPADDQVTYHVAPNPRGGWSVRLTGATRASSNQALKVEAVARGRELARARSGRLVVHRQDGSVQEETEYSR